LLYNAYADIPGFARLATLDEIGLNDGNLSIPLYVRAGGLSEVKGEYAVSSLTQAVSDWQASSEKLSAALELLLQTLV
jgi:type I restriction enzyme M protein